MFAGNRKVIVGTFQLTSPISSLPPPVGPGPCCSPVPSSCVCTRGGLISAVRDHVMRALCETEMLAAEVPADVHELDSIERASAAPRSSGCVSAFALEHVLDAHQSVLIQRRSPRHAHVGRDVREQANV